MTTLNKDKQYRFILYTAKSVTTLDFPGENMRKIHSIIVSFSFLVASVLAAHAGDVKDMKDFHITPVLQKADSGMYVAVEGGADFTNVNGTRQYQIGDVGPTRFFDSGIFKGDGNGTNTVGGVGGIKVGYDFEPYDITEGLRLQPAVELEALYIGGTDKNNFSYSPGELITVKSSYTNAAVLLNGIVRFKIDCPVTPYLGFGIGTEYFNANNISLSTDHASGGGSVSYGSYDNGNWVLAGQGLFGLDISLNKNWSLFTEYKFIILDDPRTKVSNFGSTGADYLYRPGFIGQNIGTAGVKYSF